MGIPTKTVSISCVGRRANQRRFRRKEKWPVNTDERRINDGRTCNDNNDNLYKYTLPVSGNDVDFRTTLTSGYNFKKHRIPRVHVSKYIITHAFGDTVCVDNCTRARAPRNSGRIVCDRLAEISLRGVHPF